MAIALSEPAPLEFDHFYRDQFRAALTLATLLTHDHGRANELVQEVFVTAYRRWDRLAVYDRPDLWARRAVINRCLSWRRRSRSEQRALRRLPAAAPAPAIGVGIDDEIGVWRLVPRLPGRQAQAIALVYGDDLAIDDAARVMRCSPGAVKTHLSRARARLESMLEEEP